MACAIAMLILPGVTAAQEESSETSEPVANDQAQGAYRVQNGDTLWGLAGTYLSSPFLWPQIYQLNTDVIEDPHWIYPGESLSLPGAVAANPAPADASLVAAEPLESWDAAQQQAASMGRSGVSVFGGTSVFDKSVAAMNVMGDLDLDIYTEPRLISNSDFYRAPLLVAEEDLPYIGMTVRKLEGNPLGLRLPAGVRLYDHVIVELQTLQVVEGDELRAIRWERSLDGRRVVRSVAMLRVVEAGEDTARAEVTRIFADYSVGDPVILAEGFDISETLEQAEEADGLKTTVAGFEVDQALVGESEMIFLNAGSDDGVRVGDEFVVFDRLDTADTARQDRLATIRILRVTTGTSTGRVVDLRDTSPEAGAPARRILRAIGN